MEAAQEIDWSTGGNGMTNEEENVWSLTKIGKESVGRPPKLCSPKEL